MNNKYILEGESWLKKEIKTFSKKVALATLASSIVMAPTFSANASTSTNNKSAVTVETIKSTNTTAAAVSLSAVLQASTLSSTVSILDSEGWLESANVEWSPVQNATGYDVYYKSASALDSEYKQLDNQLIRKYASYYRADALGLAEGNYVIKIVPIVNNQEIVSSQAITKTLSVKANTREGFAFSKQSPMGTGSGGYKDDGTVASNAQVLYITASTANTVTTDVITNAKGTKTTCTGIANILAARQKGYDKTPLIIRMIGQVKASDITGLNSTGYLQLKGCYNVTLEGVGEDATVYGWGILIRDAHNVEVRNLGIMMFPDDGVSLDTDNENIWVHNNDFFYGAPGSDADQVKGDGSCDIKQTSTYVTVSYNHFHDSGKCSLCGMLDTNNFFVTYHHNWFDHSDSRHPRIRVGSVHVYNNYFDGNAKYGVGVTKGASAFVEGNYFRDCRYPMLSSLQGSDLYEDPKGNFSGEAGGIIKAYNNQIVGATRIVYANQDATQFDAYLASSRNEAVPSTYKTVSGGTTYNNFDTSSTMYSYTPDSPEAAKDKVTAYAGRVDGGDFKWTFTDADDTDHSVNAELKAKIVSYTSDLVSVGGNSASK
jgi:pectate lyase